MTPDILPDLKSRLAACADAWARANDAPVSRIAKRVTGNAVFFENLADMRRGPSTDTLERFAGVLVDPAEWPEGAVPEEVTAFGHAVGVSAPAGAEATGKAGEMSGLARRDAA